MPRDGSGNYTLPAGNPVVDDTIIETSWANPTMSDIAAQLNNVITQDGLRQPLLPIKFVDGTSALPGATFAAQLGTGLWNAAASAGYSFRGVSHVESSAGRVTVKQQLRFESGILSPTFVGVSASTYTVLNSDFIIRFAGANCTVTLPSGAENAGRMLLLCMGTAHTLDSASSDVQPLSTAAPGTAILSGSGKWALLARDAGPSGKWYIVAFN